jgi:hypothetical protein
MTKRSPLKPGIYRLRSVTVDHPDPGIGGLYATGHGVGETVRPFPESPPFVDRQNVRLIVKFVIAATFINNHHYCPYNPVACHS